MEEEGEEEEEEEEEEGHRRPRAFCHKTSFRQSLTEFQF